MSDAYETPAGPLRALAQELARSGVRDVVVCPGSRSAPLALAVRADGALRTWVHLDERAAAFFALGLAKVSRRPTAIVVTSGTAAAELMPALVEARYGRVPIVALTADRPLELRDRGAPQTIDQDHLFGRHAKWYAELPVPEDLEAAEAHVRAIIARAVATAQSAPAGPVHLDMPFREPLVPVGDLRPGTLVAAGATAQPPAILGLRALDEPELDRLARAIGEARRGLIVCGPLDLPDVTDPLTRLAVASGFPILADGLSNLRHGPHDRSHVIARADALVRVADFAATHQPDLVLRIGATPTSRALVEWLRAGAAPQIVVDDGGWNEATLLPVTMVAAEPARLAAALAERVTLGTTTRSDEAWLESWGAADEAAGEALSEGLAALGEPFEGQVFDSLSASLPDGAVLLAGNSMPVRDLDAFLGGGPSSLRCLGNRGANGIDGLVSTALGAAAGTDAPVIAVVGDISLLHDLNALVAAARLRLSLTLVLVHNDGGGIFSFLPQASTERPEAGLPEHYEELFGTPHGLDFGPIVQSLGASHELVAPAGLGAAVLADLGRPGVKVLEVRTERARNVELHGALLDAVERALRPLVGTAAVPPSHH